MVKKRLFWIISSACIILSIFYSWTGVAQAPNPKVLLSTNPPLEKILPFEAEAKTPQYPVKLTLKAVDAVGKPLKNAQINLQISTPSRHPWLTTDFPMVEGTKLLQIDANAPDGTLDIQQILPIRGKYQLQVKVSPLIANAFSPYEQILDLNVPENPTKYQYFACLATILLLVGLLGGWIIGGQEELRPGEIAPQSVRLLLSGVTVVAIVALLFINISAEVAENHHGEHHHHSSSEKIAPYVQKAQGLEVILEGDKDATVGQLANLTVQVKDTATEKPIQDVALQVKAIALEHDITVFTYTGVPNSEGKLTWLEQFFDGSPHQIEVEATPLPSSSRQFSTLKVAQEVEVEGIAPPIYIRLIGLFYFTIIVGMGMAIGMLIQQRRKPKVTAL
ncbi:hypothetical protein B6N60_05296 [Richelia sinica FACHB-800]|uniref:Uncharacterized protein n=1 Tax=Richelia sinica FACHB-800 TaxID=1357546 RepID=A0A975Y7P9_9NOST|nr:hypothetical protein [Richelia sinica]MBD2665568.1 hypothetical protein [Richelia sinica FACHB-800]QXE26563.1 hypothetical protein B6N60_05296 [Richelia sinica FACHB-800]